MKTSEMLFSIVPTLVGCFLIYLGVTKGQADLLTAGTAMVIGGPASYSVSRGMAKMNAPPTPPAEVKVPPKDAAEAADVLGNIP
jgi:hypothetical protein